MVVSEIYSLTQASVASEACSEMCAREQADSAVDSAVAAALKELRDESEYDNIVNRDESNTVTV
ncbi:hypothetical protein GN958_ATG05135 [Phytophthora infestans]|uniref:Uncharacterized protein n=1 Tax=Phytophthora infestans TaxID=4787 RepID=A0A8S9UZA0_PHYIN|nr:hypothetical protein GN958_ATG05135 [Phytophthora infestans]